MTQLSLRDNWLKFKTAGKSPVILEKNPRIYPNLMKETRRMSTCNRLDLQTLGSQSIMPKNLPDYWFCVCKKVLLPNKLAQGSHTRL